MPTYQRFGLFLSQEFAQRIELIWTSVTAAELLLEKLTLLQGERPWESLRWTWKILAPDQANEFRKLMRASQFVKRESAER